MIGVQKTVQKKLLILHFIDFYAYAKYNKYRRKNKAKALRSLVI